MLYRTPDLFGAGHDNDVLTPAIAYLGDAAQRQVLFWDVMRQRGNQYREALRRNRAACSELRGRACPRRPDASHAR